MEGDSCPSSGKCVEMVDPLVTTFPTHFPASWVVVVVRLSCPFLFLASKKRGDRRKRNPERVSGRRIFPFLVAPTLFLDSFLELQAVSRRMAVPDEIIYFSISSNSHLFVSTANG